MAFISGAGGAGGLVRRPVNPYPAVAPPRPAAVQQPGALAPTLAPPVFNMPPPIDPSGFGAQAAAEAQRQIDPILQLIAARSNAQAQYTQQSVSALTNVYASRLAGMADMAKSTYAPEIKTSKALGGGLNSYMTGAGKAAAATEAGATGLEGMSAGSDVPLAAEGAGAGNAAEAIQAGMTEALKTAQSAAVKYAGSLPGFAQAEGKQFTNDTLKTLAATMANQLAEVTAQAPTLYHQLYNEFLDRAESDRNFQLEMAKLQYSIDSDNYDRQAAVVGPKAPTTQGKLAYWTKIAAERTASDTEGRQWFADPNGNGINFRKGVNGQPVRSKDWIDKQAEVIIRTHSTPQGALTPEGAKLLQQIGYTKFAGTGPDPKLASKAAEDRYKAAQAKAKADADRAERARAADQANATALAAIAQRSSAAADRLKIARDKATAAAAKTAAGKGPKPPTSTSISNLVDSWYNGKPTTTRQQNTDGTTTIIQGPVQGQLGYNEALRRLVALHVPEAEARSVLDTRYKRGERGRAWLPASARSAMAKAGLTPHVHYTAPPGKGGTEAPIAYFDLAQAKWLKAQGLLPDGKYMNGRYQLYAP
jgi:hypothetical protein